MAMSFWYIEQVEAMHASYSVVFCRILRGTVLRFDWFFHLLHWFEGDMLS